jgi:hypothetical protein
MKTVNKFGKKIRYSIDGVNGSWMVVEDGGEQWVHATKKDMKIPNIKTNPLLCNKKGMWDLFWNQIRAERSIPKRGE